MYINTNAGDTLRNPSVEKYFLSIIKSDLDPKAKYEKFIEFFKEENRIADSLQKSMSQLTSDYKIDDEKMDLILAEAGNWDPKKTLLETEDSIKRAVLWINKNKYTDGGWGFDNKSNVWGTAYAVLCQHSVKKLKHLAIDIETGLEDGIKHGIKWLESDKNRAEWSVENIPPSEGVAVYEIALMIKCSSQVKGFSGKTPLTISRCIDTLIKSQNIDGGWDIKIWGTEAKSPKRFCSEAGATSFVLQALTLTERKDIQKAIKKGVIYLIENQEEDGCWIDTACEPTDSRYGEPSINKTCDAVAGILIGKEVGIDIEGFRDNIDRAVDWIQSMEKPILNDTKMEITGWEWPDIGDTFKLENTCLALETLVKMPNTYLPLLTLNAQWLIRKQCRQDDSKDDGSWKDGHTARIAISLINYYKKIKNSHYLEGKKNAR